MGKAKEEKIPLPGLWDRLEIRPLITSVVTGLPVRLAELRVVVKVGTRMVVTAPDIQAGGRYGPGTKYLLRYSVSSGLVEVESFLHSEEKDANNHRYWVFDPPVKISQLQRRTEVRVPVFLPVEFDLVSEGLFEKRLAKFHGSVIDLSFGGAVMLIRSDAETQLSKRAKVFVRFALPDSGPFGEISGRILRVEREHLRTKPQMKITIQFIKMSNAAEQLIRDYCLRRESFLRLRV